MWWGFPLSWKFMKVWTPPPFSSAAKSPKEFLDLKLVHTQPQRISRLPLRLSCPWFTCSSGFCFQLAIIQAMFCIYLSFKFGGNNLPCDLSFLVGLRRVVDYQFAQLFPCYRVGVMTSKLFPCWIRNPEVELTFI